MVAITDTNRPQLAKAKAPAQAETIASVVEEAVRRRIAACPYNFVFDKITCHIDDGKLTLCGSVPTYYLKQVLQELLRDLEQIDGVANDVQVVSSIGLSSARPSESS